MEHTRQIVRLPTDTGKLTVVNVSEKNQPKKRRVFKRVSPFMLLTFFLIFVLFPYIVFFDNDIYHPRLKLFLIPVITIYAVYADFVIWNYFEGKKKSLIWLMEGMLSVAIIYLLI